MRLREYQIKQLLKTLKEREANSYEKVKLLYRQWLQCSRKIRHLNSNRFHFGENRNLQKDRYAMKLKFKKVEFVLSKYFKEAQ